MLNYYIDLFAVALGINIQLFQVALRIILHLQEMIPIMKKIISYNVNGIRAAMRKGFIDWMKAADADIICIQETKAQPGQIPIFEFAELGYKTFVYSAKKKGNGYQSL